MSQIIRLRLGDCMDVMVQSPNATRTASSGFSVKSISHTSMTGTPC